MQKFQQNVQNRQGDVIAGASVDVTVTSTNRPAALFSDNGVTSLTQPLTTDANGGFFFFAANGTYDVTVTGTTFAPIKWTAQILFDPDDADIPSSAALAGPSGVELVGGTWFGGAVAKVSALATSAGASLIGFIQAGTGAVARSLQDELRDRVSVKQFGAKGDGIADDTAAIQNAINYVETLNYLAPGFGRPAVLLPAGVYISGPLTVNRKTALIGDGSPSTFIRLVGGATESLLTINAEDVAGTSIDDANHSIIQGATLIGNRVDSTTTGASHGIYCPSTLWSQAAQYSTAFRGRDLVIYNFTGNGIHLGANRNWMILDGAIVRYCNDNALASYSYDSRISNSDFGVCKNFGVRQYAGGANAYSGCNLYFNTINLVINDASNSPSWFVNCSFDYALQNGASISGSPLMDAYTFTGCRFYGNSRSGANLYSDILMGGAERIQVMGTQFLLGDQKVKYLIETGSVTQVYWVGNAYDATGGPNTPYQTAITNDFSRMSYAGANDAYLGSAGNGTMSLFASGEVLRVDGSFNRNYRPVRIENANPRQWAVVSGAAANEGKWVVNYGATVLQLLASDDTETGFNAAHVITRSGNTITQYELRGTAIKFNSTALGFYNATPVAKPTVTGSWGGNTAGASLAAALATLGLITNSTSA